MAVDPAIIERVRDLVAADNSYLQISQIVGITRSAVAGICARNGFKRASAVAAGGWTVRAEERRHRAKERRTPMIREAIERKPVAEIVPTRPVVVAPVPEPVPALPIERRPVAPAGDGCDWIEGDVLEGTATRCGKPKAAKPVGRGLPCPYCQEHRDRAYHPVPKFMRRRLRDVARRYA